MTATILAMAVGPTLDLSIRNQRDIKNVRPYIDGLVDGLAALQKQLGTDYTIDYRQREPEDLSTHKTATKAFAPNPAAPYELIFAMSTTVVLAAQRFAGDFPIVWPSVSDPKHDGIDGKNATGICARRSQTAGDCFHRFLATVPTLKTVFYLHKEGYGPAELALIQVREAAQERHIVLKPLLIQTEQDINTKLAGLEARNLQTPAESGVLVLPVDLCLGAAARIVQVVQGGKNLPAFFPITDVVKPPISALGGYGVSQQECGSLSAEYVQRILFNKERAGELRVKNAEDHSLDWVVSRAAAEALNIQIARVI
jgi:ABC-type uncharacterized transport system substrate-binding protein